MPTAMCARTLKLPGLPIITTPDVGISYLKLDNGEVMIADPPSTLAQGVAYLAIANQDLGGVGVLKDQVLGVVAPYDGLDPDVNNATAVTLLVGIGVPWLSANPPLYYGLVGYNGEGESPCSTTVSGPTSFLMGNKEIDFEQITFVPDDGPPGATRNWKWEEGDTGWQWELRGLGSNNRAGLIDNGGSGSLTMTTSWTPPTSVGPGMLEIEVCMGVDQVMKGTTQPLNQDEDDPKLWYFVQDEFLMANCEGLFVGAGSLLVQLTIPPP